MMPFSREAISRFRPFQVTVLIDWGANTLIVVALAISPVSDRF